MSSSNLIIVFGIVLFAAVVFSAEIGNVELNEELDQGKANNYFTLVVDEIEQDVH